MGFVTQDEEREQNYGLVDKHCEHEVAKLCRIHRLIRSRLDLVLPQECGLVGDIQIRVDASDCPVDNTGYDESTIHSQDVIVIS